MCVYVLIVFAALLTSSLGSSASRAPYVHQLAWQRELSVICLLVAPQPNLCCSVLPIAAAAAAAQQQKYYSVNPKAGDKGQRLSPYR